MTIAALEAKHAAALRDNADDHEDEDDEAAKTREAATRSLRESGVPLIEHLDTEPADMTAQAALVARGVPLRSV